MSSNLKLNRRDFLKASAITATGLLVQACAKAPTTAPEQEPTQAPAQPTQAPAQPTATQKAAEQPQPTAAPEAAQEAPMWADMVSSGSLESLSERLPQDPEVVNPFQEVGQYSKDVHRSLKGASDLTGYRVIVRDDLVTWDYSSGNLTIANDVCSEWELTPDAKEYTFTLRKGLKWSDGAPLTADDFVFYYEDMLLNEERTPSFPVWLMSGGEPAVFEKLDDYTVKVSFSAPYSLLPQFLCFRFGSIEIFCPKHYLSQFHPAYADKDALAKAVSDAGFDEWFQLFGDRIEYTVNPEMPVAKAWIVTTPFPGQQMISERTPYYWKVDTEGKQLPYFDQMINDYSADNEAVLLKVIAGEIDFQYRNIGYANFSLLKENEADGNYQVLEWRGGNWPCVYVNQSVTDLALRELFQNRDFRYALSYGINRQEVNELMFYGQAYLVQPVAWDGDPYWLPEFNHTAVEFDPDQGNALLDGLGLDQRDSEGYRLRSDGQRIELQLVCYPSEMGVPAIDIFTKVAEYWDTNLSIRSTAEEVERSLWSQRAQAGELMMPSYDIAKYLWVIDPTWFVPVVTDYFAPLFGTWYETNGAGGEEPPDYIKEITDLYEKLVASADPDQALEYGREILRIHDRELFIIGVVKLPFQPMVRHNTMVNVLDKGIAEYRTFHEGLTWPEQLWRRA